MPLKAIGMLGGALLIVLFVRLLHDPHIPPKLYWLSWLAALLVMSRIGCHGGMWLNLRSPAALPAEHTLKDVVAKLVVWTSFGIGLPMAAFSTMGLIARLGAPGRPPGPPPGPPGPPHPDSLATLWDAVLNHGGGHGHGGDPGIFLGMAMVFVPTALLCLAAAPCAKAILKKRELLGPLDHNALMAGMATILYSLAVLWFVLEPSQDRVKHGLMMMFCPLVLPNHAIASAAAAGVWKVWFAVRKRCCGSSCAEEPAPESPPAEEDKPEGGKRSKKG